MAERTWGLNSLARSGQVGLDLDESTDAGPTIFLLTLVLPFVELRFQITDIAVIDALSQFLNERYGRKGFAELQLGVLDGIAVRIIKDDEHADRFFIRAAGRGMIDITIIDPIASDLVRAAAELSAESAAR